MISPGITVFLSILFIANLLLFAVVLYSSRGRLDTATKAGFAYMATVLILDMFALFGGVKFW